MKKILRGILMLTSLTALGGCFVSCDDDDDKGGSSPSVETYEIGKTGRLLTSVGSDRWFRYDTQGQLTEFYDGDFTWSVKNNPLSISDAYYDEDDYEGLKWDKFSFNGKGYLTSASCTYSWRYSWGDSWGDHEGSGSVIVSMKFHYDGIGHLTSCTQTISGDVNLDEVNEKVMSKAAASVVWNGGRITSATVHWDFSEGSYAEYKYEDGDMDVTYAEYEDVDMTFSYPLEPVVNPFAQPNVAFYDVISRCFDDGSLGTLAFINLFGVGMSELPTSFEAVTHRGYINEDGRKYEDSYTDRETYTTTFNADGSIASERRSGSTYRYTYDDSPSAESATRAVAPARADAPSAARHRHGSLRRHAPLRKPTVH